LKPEFSASGAVGRALRGSIFPAARLLSTPNSLVSVVGWRFAPQPLETGVPGKDCLGLSIQDEKIRMRLESAFRTGREGIIAHGQAISVIGDNISNANTTAFKSQRAEFVDILGERVNERNSEITAGVGDGVTIGNVRLDYSDGATLATGRELDVALSGRGFFLVGDIARPTLTRSGNFQISKEGFLETSDGLPVLGYSGTDVNELGPINMVKFNVEPQATTQVGLFTNLNGSGPLTPVPQNPTTFKEINSAAAFTSSLNVYDASGDRHDVQLFYFKTAPNQWTAQAYVNGSEVGQQADTPVLLGEVQLGFNAFGAIPPENQAQARLEINPAWSNGAPQTALTIDMANFTQYAGGSRVTKIDQDGRGNGDVVSYNIGDDGKIFGVLNTGEQVQAGSLAVGLVNSVDGLERLGGSRYAVTEASGALDIGLAGVGGRGSMVGRALESSNVDLPGQFTEMIVIQRGYQANSQVLSAANDLIKNTIQMIR